MMNKPKLTCYLAGPINGCTDDECKNWRQYVQDQLPDINFLDPMRRDYRAPGSDQDIDAYTNIVESDKDDIDNSDIVLVYHDRPSVGTSMEILYAFERSIYVLTIGCTGKVLSPWILYHSHAIVNTLDEAIEKIKEIEEKHDVYEVPQWEDGI